MNPEIKNRFSRQVCFAEGGGKVIVPAVEKNYADLSGAVLRTALPDLYLLKLLPPKTPLRAWKYLRNGTSPYQGFPYEVGKEYTFEPCSQDEHVCCAEGGNVATLSWCLRDSSFGDEFIEVEFTAADIAAIPFATDGKFRVRRLKVLRKLNRGAAEQVLDTAMNLPTEKEATDED